MFLNLLSNDEKRAFAVLAAKMIEADGIVIDREAAALSALRAEMGMTEKSGSGDATVDDLAAVFSSRRSKVAALLELIGLGYSDTDFSVTESSLVAKTAASMGLSEYDVSRLEGWVRKHVALIRQALVLMRE
jgi:uncharacterized tellurite resistance protein B-like protein